jgi:UDP-glucose 4-epimerase
MKNQSFSTRKGFLYRNEHFMRKVLVTGGAGFIGSHLVDALMSGKANVHVFDNLSSGSIENIKQWLKSPNFTLIKGDLLNLSDMGKLRLDRYDFILHLAANPEVRVSSINPGIHFQQNVVATYNLLEWMRKYDSASTIAFTSTSTVYGEAIKISTPEDYAPLKPISIYGASKLACEALIIAYAYTYGFKTIIYRLANIVGPRSVHGVIYDFIRKLKKNPEELEILGDGMQTKSYLYISDCIEAMSLGLEKLKEQVEIYNVGSEDQISVKTIAQIVIEEMGLKNVKLKFTGGVNGGRGWIGDVKNMLLDISKLKALGWKPKLNSEQAIREAVRNYIAKLH